MSTFLQLLRWDLTMQYRYGFWAAGIGVTAMWVVALSALSPEHLKIWLPVVLYFDIGVIGLMFIAGLLFFERRQGVIDALVVSPLRTPTWLLSKLVGLVTLATVVACALVLLTVGPGADWLRLVPSFALAAALFTLLGFLVATRFGSISSFFAALGLLGVPLGLPIFEYFGVLTHPLMWLNPAQPSLVLVRLAFRKASAGEAVAATFLTLLWIGVAFTLSVQAFHRRVSWRRGAV